MSSTHLVTYCGLYCDLCAQRTRVPRQAQALRETMTKEGYEYFGHEMTGFTEFWRFLTDLASPDKACPGCRQNGGYPACEIRRCARERAVEACAFCDEFPCQRIVDFSAIYPTVIADSRRMKAIGIEAWIQEQEERGKTGFAYADIRISR